MEILLASFTRSPRSCGAPCPLAKLSVLEATSSFLLQGMLFEKSAGAVIFCRAKKTIEYLLLKHSEKYWNFPKGHIEKGESEIEAARREIREETGLRAVEFLPKFKVTEKYYYRLTQDFYRVSRYRKMIFKTVVFFLAQTPKCKIKVSKEHLDYGWYNFDEALKKLRYQTGKNILIKADKFLYEHFSDKSVSNSKKNSSR